MARTYNLKRRFCEYVSDDGSTYNVATTIGNIDAQGGDQVDAGANPEYPRGWTMREVYGEAADGSKTKLPILDPQDAMWVGGTKTFTKEAVLFAIMGHRGEHRFYKGAKGTADA